MNLTFFPMHLLGTSGMPRRIADYSATAGWNDLNMVATIGGFIIAIAMLPFLWNIFTSLRGGQLAGDDPWEGSTLEWATSSPPPPGTSTICRRSARSARSSTSATRRTRRS